MAYDTRLLSAVFRGQHPCKLASVASAIHRCQLARMFVLPRAKVWLRHLLFLLDKAIVISAVLTEDLSAKYSER